MGMLFKGGIRFLLPTNMQIADNNVCADNSTVYYGDYHYMLCVKWNDFEKDMNIY